MTTDFFCFCNVWFLAPFVLHLFIGAQCVSLLLAGEKKQPRNKLDVKTITFYGWIQTNDWLPGYVYYFLLYGLIKNPFHLLHHYHQNTELLTWWDRNKFLIWKWSMFLRLPSRATCKEGDSWSELWALGHPLLWGEEKAWGCPPEEKGCLPHFNAESSKCVGLPLSSPACSAALGRPFKLSNYPYRNNWSSSVYGDPCVLCVGKHTCERMYVCKSSFHLDNRSFN